MERLKKLETEQDRRNNYRIVVYLIAVYLSNFCCYWRQKEKRGKGQKSNDRNRKIIVQQAYEKITITRVRDDVFTGIFRVPHVSMRKALQPILSYRILMLSLTRYYRQMSNRHYNCYLLAFIVASINEVTLRTLKSLVVYDFECSLKDAPLPIFVSWSFQYIARLSDEN